MVTNGLPCTFSLLSPPYSGVGSRGYKWIALHIFPTIPALLRVGGPGCKWIALHLFPAIAALLRGWGPWLQMDCLAPFSYYPRPTPGLGTVVTNGLPCTFFLLSPPYSGVGGRGCKWTDLHLFPTIPALFRGLGSWLQMDCPAPFSYYPRPSPGLGTVDANGLPCTFSYYPRPTPVLGAVVTNGLPCTFFPLSPPYSGVGGPGCKWIALHLFPTIPALLRGWGLWLQMDCPAPFSSYPRPTPGLGAVVANGLPCTFFLLSPPYSGVGGRGYKWIALHLFPTIPTLLRGRGTWLQMDYLAPFSYYLCPTPGLGAVVTNGLPCTFFLLSPPYSGVGGRGFKWIALHIFPTIPALPRGWGPWLQMDFLAPFSYYHRLTPVFGAVVTNGLPCTFFLLSPPYSGVGGCGYKWIALNIFPAIPTLLRGWGPWLQIDCLAPFSYYPRPTPWLGAVVTNGLPCTFSLLSPPYSGVGGRGYKWTALYLFPTIPALLRG